MDWDEEKIIIDRLSERHTYNLFEIWKASGSLRWTLKFYLTEWKFRHSKKVRNLLASYEAERAEHYHDVRIGEESGYYDYESSLDY